MFRILNTLLTSILLIAFVSSCATSSKTTSRESELKSASYYLSMAKNSSSPLKSEYLLKAGTILAQNQQYLKAQESLSVIRTEDLQPTQLDSYYLYYGLSLLELAQSEAALLVLEKVSQPNLQDLDWQILYQSTLANTYLANNNYFEAAVIRIKLEDILLSEIQVKENHQAIWLALGSLSSDFLQTMSVDVGDSILEGWLNLVRIRKQYDIFKPQELVTNLNIWKQRYPLHPASQYMPDELQQISNAKIFQPKKVALLLPLSGQLATGAKMIRDGFFSAHYQQSNANSLEVAIYDTTQTLSILSTYNQARDDGADFIVGPLTKEAVAELANLESIDIPILSLNQISLTNPRHPDFFQFGLPAEDESEQVADMAILKGHKQALIIAPKSEQGERIALSFKNRFELLSGKVAQIEWFEDVNQTKSSVQKLLNIDKSEKRASVLQQVTGTLFETVQRRRQDADMIFLVATASEARRIKPFLNYFFAQDLPIYSTSRINSGEENPQLNKDLNGITFVDSPFLVSKDPHYSIMKEQLKPVMPGIQSSLGRLFALGFDAYRILPNLHLIQALQQFQTESLSGELSVNLQGEVKRRLNVAEYHKGTVRDVVSEKP